MSVLLEAEGLNFSYKDTPILREFTLAVNRGETFGLLGPNGSGKSTFLKLLCGLNRPSHGQFRFNGAEFISPPRQFREALGVVFQSPALDEKLTARQNLELAARIHGIAPADWKERIDSMFSQIGLSSRSEDAVSTFSGGMKRKLDLGRALLHGPSLLVMDEPTSGLDEASFRSLWELLTTLKEEKTLTVLVATHRPEEGEMCDRIAVIHEGEVTAVNTPEELKQGLAQDVVTLHSPCVEQLAAEIGNLPGVVVTTDSTAVKLECDEGAQMIATIANRVPREWVSRFQLRQPGLGDAFLKLTGNALDTAEAS